MTQEEFGKLLEVAKSTVINYECGRRSPDALFLTRLAEKFDVDASWLLLGYVRSNDMKIQGEMNDNRVHKLVECLSIPVIRLLLVAEYERLRVIFRDLIDGFEKDKIERSKMGSTQYEKEIS